MVRMKWLVVGLLVVVLAAGAIVYLLPTEEKKVRRQFANLAKWLSKEPGESAITMAHHLQNIGTVFGETCELEIPSYSVTGQVTREEISGYAARGRAQFSKLSVEFLDLKVVFLEQGLARVNVTAKVTGKTMLGEMANEVHELECRLKRVDKKWLFHEIKVVEVLKR